MKKYAVLIIFFLVGIACSNSSPETVTVRETVIAEVPVTVEVISEVEIERTVEVTREIEVTREFEVTRIVEIPVTVTPTHTPVNSPTPSNTPTITLTPSSTPTPTPSSTPTLTPTPTQTPNFGQTATIEAYGVLAAPKGNGFYTVGVEILAGKWRSTGTGRGCYWARLDSEQNLLDNHFGLAGGTVTIRETDSEVEFDDCGNWIYVEDEIPVLQDDAASNKGDGFYTVGIEIVPGRWVSTGTDDGCYWARLDGNQNIIDNHFGNSGGSVTIQPSDYEVEFSDCGSWQLAE